MLNHSILTKERVKIPTGFVQVISFEVEKLKEKTNVYNLNALGYHTYVVGNDLLVVHNTCAAKKKGVYELDFDDGTRYIGKGSIQCMKQSIKM